MALAKDADGKTEEAVKSVQIAARLASSHSEVNWMLANLLLRQGKQSEALTAFRVATRTRSDLLPAALDLIWQSSGNDPATLNYLVNGDVNARLIQAQFLAEQGQTEAAINVYRSIDVKTKLNTPGAPAFISWLIQSNFGAEARSLWIDVVGEKGAEGSGIWNGSFEQNSPKDFGHFDWAIKASNYARIGFDRSVAHSGVKSLKLVFVGRDTTKLENEIQQLVVLKANVRYRLECFAKTGNLVTPEGPRIALLGRPGVLAASEPVVVGATGWQHLVVDFVALPENLATHVSIVRIPKKDYDEPTKGTIWFDDFKLTEQ
ncbi:MAG: tetratricopeptide repeat protein [Blastocatellia bacterium]